MSEPLRPDDFDTDFDLIAGKARDILAGYREAATATRNVFDSFVEAGFTEEQALELTKELMRGARESV